MSLINDALKRARETQRNEPPPGAPPLPPVEAPARGGAGWVLAAAAVLFFAAAGLIFGPALFGHRTVSSVAATRPAIPAPPPVAIAPASASNAPPATPITNPPPAAVVVERWPKVQGIIFNSARPLAIVNGQTVNAGDRVGNFQVKQILETSIVFQRPDGTQKTLGIGD
jgi:hypothetical protein